MGESQDMFIGDCLFDPKNGKVVAYHGYWTGDDDEIGYKLKCMKVAGGSDCGKKECKLYQKKSVIF